MSEEVKDVNLQTLLESNNTSVEVRPVDSNVFSLTSNPFDLPLRISTFSSEKEIDSFIKYTERTVRHSLEYRYWVNYITEHLGQSECSLTHENINECSIEVHHHPINMYTIVKCVLNDFLVKNIPFSTFDISTKVIELHYQNKVGYMVLLSDLHKKFHSGFLKLPIDMVQGNYKQLLSTFTFDENEQIKINELCSVTSEDLTMKWAKDDYPGIRESAKLLEESKKNLLAG